jgi:hypothetical protein
MNHFGLTGSQWRIHVEAPEMSSSSLAEGEKKDEKKDEVKEGENKEDERKEEKKEEKKDRPVQWLQIDKRLMDYDPPLLLEVTHLQLLFHCNHSLLTYSFTASIYNSEKQL